MDLEIRPAVVALFFVCIIGAWIGLNAVLIYFQKTDPKALTREAVISQVGPWLDQKLQVNESGEHFVQRSVARMESGEIYSCKIGLIDVRGFGSSIVAGLSIDDYRGQQTRYFRLNWSSYSKTWKCDFSISTTSNYRKHRHRGASPLDHPEKSGYGSIGRLFHIVRWEDITEYKD